jgi:CheY-like chemotaxis protein
MLALVWRRSFVLFGNSDMHVLIAETNILLLREMKQALLQAGHQVTACNDGMGAWGYLASTAPPDLLITSINLGVGMPPGTALAMHARSRKIPIIYIPESADMAAHADPEHGAILLQPFGMTSLVETTQRCFDNGYRK